MSPVATAARSPRGSHAVVIGAGIGGLATAIRLLAAGLRVTVCERAATVGGKLREVEVAGRKLDAGPSVLTMPFVFEELFAAAGRRLADHVTLRRVDPACRHFFPDGSRLDLYDDRERSREAIRAFSGAASARAFDAFCDHAARIYEIVREPFMESPVPSKLDLLRPPLLFKVPQMMRIDSGRTLWKALEETFPDERLRVLFGRYATYNGSSPLHAPGTLAVIAHVELAFGIHVVEGGLYRLAEALAELVRALGGELRTGAAVERVVVERGRAVGVELRGERIPADLVVANCDVLQLYDRLLAGVPGAARAGAKLAALEPSLSAYVLLAVARVGDFPLAHHNVFFSRDYRREFRELVDERRPPADPTLYLCAEDRAPGRPALAAGEAERHLLLTNAPSLDGRVDWAAEELRCRARVGEVLARYGVPFEVEGEQAVAPPAWEALFPSSRGSIYGAASNSKMAAFERPANRVPGFERLYCVGGSAHPGAGMPMVALSARIAARQALDELGHR